MVGQLVRGWCAFEGAPEEVWRSMGEDRKDVEEMTGSALEVGPGRDSMPIRMRMSSLSLDLAI